MKGNRIWENANGEKSLDPFADIQPNIVYPSPTHVYVRHGVIYWFLFGIAIGIGIGLFISVLI